MNSTDTYYIWRNEQQEGPFTESQMKSMWNSGTIDMSTLYWQDGFEEWQSVSLLREIFEAQQTAPAPKPPAKSGSQRGLITAAYIFSCTSIIPLLGYLTGLVGFILGIVLCAKNQVKHGVINIVLSIFLAVILPFLAIFVLGLLGNELQQTFNEIETQLEEEMPFWEVRHFVDSFNEPTDDAYVVNYKSIRGTFSNSAVKDRELLVRFLISNETDVAIMLYEYADDSPVAGSSDYPKEYLISVRDPSGKNVSFTAKNSSDRLSLLPGDSKYIHKIFLDGGTIKFSIKEKSTYPSTYNFTVDDGNTYAEIFSQLDE